MIKQLRKVGNSNALILDKPILELLGLEEEGLVQLIIQDGNLLVTPTRPRPVSAESVHETIEQVLQKRYGLLQRLAK